MNGWALSFAGIFGFLNLSTPSAAQEAAEEKLDVYTLARVILPAEQAKTIASYRPDEGMVPGAPWRSVTLLSRPEKIAAGICRRDTYEVGLPLGRGTHPSVIQSHIPHWVGLAVADSCDTLSPFGAFAQIQSQAVSPVQAAQRMAWLRRAIQGKGSEKPKFSLKCSSTMKDSGCTNNPKKVFADLSFDNLFIVSKEDSGDWEFIFSTGIGGALIWTISVEGMNDLSPVVTIKEEIPAPT